MQYVYWAIKSRFTHFFSQRNYNTEMFNDLVMPEANYRNLNGSITMCSERNIILYSVRQHNHFIV